MDLLPKLLPQKQWTLPQGDSHSRQKLPPRSPVPSTSFKNQPSLCAEARVTLNTNRHTGNTNGSRDRVAVSSDAERGLRGISGPHAGAKTSPEVPVPSTSFKNQPSSCAEARATLNINRHTGNTNGSHDRVAVSSDAERGLRGISGPHNGARVPAMSGAMRPLPSNPPVVKNNLPTRVPAGNAATVNDSQSSMVNANVVSNGLRTPRQPHGDPSTRHSSVVGGNQHGQVAQQKNSPPQYQISSNFTNFSNSSNRETSLRNIENNFQSKGTPNAGGSFSGGIAQRAMNVASNTSQMRSPSTENNLQSNHMNRMPNAHGSSNGGIGQRGINVPPSTPQMRPGTGTTFRNTGNNIQSKGTPNAGGCFNGGIGQRGMNVPPNTPQMRPGNETSFRSTGNSIQSKGTTNAGCGFQGGISQRGTSAAPRTPQMRPSGAYNPRTVNQGARFNTPTGNQSTSRAFQTNQSSPLPHGRGRPIPGMGGNVRPPTPVTTPRSGPTPPRQNPGQGRTVLTPRVAQLCQGSGPSPGAGAHGGTRKFPGPAGSTPQTGLYLQFISHA